MSSGNECISLGLVNPVTAEPVAHAFNPLFTYFFGQGESDEAQEEDYQIFGYKELAIDIGFRAHDMKIHVKKEYDGVFPAIGEIKPIDLDELLKEYLPTDYSTEPETVSQEEIDAWKPPGEVAYSYTIDDDKWEIWCASLTDQKARDILRNMQILVPLYIEGGTCQDLEDQDWTLERWKIYFL